MKVVVGVLLLLSCAALASAESEIDVAATLSARWGHWTLERLRWKREELNSDLTATRQERNRVNTWGTKTCELIVAMGKARVMAAKEAVSEWTDILAIRRGQRGYHIGRQAGYDRRHLYITEGPLARRNAADKAAWCKANPESCDRWEHERAVYFKHGFDKMKDRHGWDTEHHRKRVGYAKENLKKANDALATARQIRNDRNAACQKTFAEAKAHWKKRIDWLKTRIVTVNQVIQNVKNTRVEREKTYKPFYMSKCRYIGGKHHMYYCRLDLGSPEKAHHRFRVCHPRGEQPKDAGVLKFRCYK